MIFFKNFRITYISSLMNRGEILLLTLILYTVSILFLIITPDDPEILKNMGLTTPTMSTLGHITAFGIFGLLVFHFLKSNTLISFRCKYPFRTSYIIAISFSVFTELLQFGLPGRFPSFTDLGIDIAGISIALFVVKATI